MYNEIQSGLYHRVEGRSIGGGQLLRVAHPNVVAVGRRDGCAGRDELQPCLDARYARLEALHAFAHCLPLGGESVLLPGN